MSNVEEVDDADRAHSVSSKASVSETAKASPSRKTPNMYLKEWQISDMLEAFMTLDTEEKGYISLTAVRVAIRALGFEPNKDEMDEIAEMVNYRKTKRIAFNDFVDILTKKMFEKDSLEDIRKTFYICSGPDRKIDVDTLREIANKLDENMTDEELQEMIQEADTNGDGEVNLEEFVAMMTQMSLCGE